MKERPVEITIVMKSISLIRKGKCIFLVSSLGPTLVNWKCGNVVLCGALSFKVKVVRTEETRPLAPVRS